MRVAILLCSVEVFGIETSVGKRSYNMNLKIIATTSNVALSIYLQCCSLDLSAMLLLGPLQKHVRSEGVRGLLKELTYAHVMFKWYLLAKHPK